MRTVASLALVVSLLVIGSALCNDRSLFPLSPLISSCGFAQRHSPIAVGDSDSLACGLLMLSCFLAAC
jgi:hypothetical protein